MKNSLRNNHGFGLLEVLIAGIIGIVIMFAMSQMMTGMFRGQKRVEMKTEISYLESLVWNIASDVKTSTPNMVSHVTDPVFENTDAGIIAWNADLNKPNTAVDLGGGRSVAGGVNWGNFSVQSVRLVIHPGAVAENPPPAEPGKFQVDLELRFGTADTRGLAMMGGEFRPRVIPMYCSTDPVVGSDPPQRRIKSCVAKAAVSGPEACAALNGKWIESISRCYWGGDLKLNQFECLAAADFADGGPLYGAAVQSCYYRSSSRMKTYTCYNTTSNSVPHCVCNPIAPGNTFNGWAVKYNQRTTPSLTCNGGVLVTIPDEAVRIMDINEYADSTYLGTVDADGNPVPTTDALSLTQWEQNSKILDSVIECETRPGDMNRHKCKQDLAMRGVAGSCVFVNQARAYDRVTSTWNTTANYNGWIYVTNSRTFIPLPSWLNANRYQILQEARGYRCHTVRRIEGAESTDTNRMDYNVVIDPNDATITNVLNDENRSKKISECIFVGKQGQATDAATPAPASYDGTKGRGAYRTAYPCANDDVDVGNLIGDGTAGGEEVPTLRNGTCWYIKLLLANGYKQNARVDNTTGEYEGWVRIAENFPEGKYKLSTGAAGEPPANALIPVSGAGRKLLAMPCNGGVRIQP